MGLSILQPAVPAPLPAPLAAWVEQVLGAPPPAETLSTCDACVQLPAPGEPPGEGQYHPLTKCCTYLPVLHNFQVGALLDDPQVASEGHASVEARIAEGTGVTAVGLIGSAGYFDRYGEQSFGRDPSLRCPHYLHQQGGRCGVWAHRNATCATWFCRFDRGGASYDLWRLGLMPLLRAAEDAVSGWAVLALGAEVDDWGDWTDPRAFYRACAQLAARFSWEQVATLGGARLLALADQARALHRALLEAPLADEAAARQEGTRPALQTGP